ncbi:MAG: ribosome maturation factor RimP [Clostridiales bacterium]|nr:ribosome maturation factor RimP [Clostridiales bacterium]
MQKQKITDIAVRELDGFLADNGYELYNMEFVKEGKDWFLRIYIDWVDDGQDKYISTDDCEKVSRYLSGRLDELDPIEQNYYLEVSSPGLDRVLLTEKHYLRYSGKPVDISLYKALDGKKTYSGTLKGIVGDQIVIIDEKGAEIGFSKEQVAKTRLKVVF